METKPCYSCSTDLILTANFCLKCGSIQKCKKCNAAIISKDQTFCMDCGNQIIQTEDNITAIPRNKIEYEQKGQNRRLVADFTDNVGKDFASIFSMAMYGQNTTKKPSPFVSIQSNLKATPSALNQQNISEAEILLDEADGTLQQTVLSKIFKANENGDLDIIDNRVKHKSKRDQFIRITILYLYAQKALGNELVNKSNLNSLIDKEKLNDGNYRAWVVAEKDLFVNKDDKLELRAAGEEKAIQIIKEIANSDFQPTVSKSGGKKKKKEDTSKKETGSKSGARPTALEMINILIVEGFFDKTKTVAGIEKYCKETKGHNYTTQEINNVLKKLLHDSKIKRTKNNDNTYEYNV